jgi:uncharacterized protein (DUF1778 family)
MKTKSESTENAVEHSGNITLSERDYARVVAALTEPASPTPALVRAMRHYEEQSKANPTGNW